MSRNWLTPSTRSRQVIEIPDHTGTPVKGSIDSYARERIVRTCNGELYEREEYRRIRLWRGRRDRDVEEV